MFANASHKEPLRNLKSNEYGARKPSELLPYISFSVKFLFGFTEIGQIFHNKYIFSNKKTLSKLKSGPGRAYPRTQ